ncbi:hypothetical protein HMPREF3232_00693 [Fannyhessea vaginae]|nr:hypothetical protein HMPREF3232_00693 [Fannyhessea vaginae]
MFGRQDCIYSAVYGAYMAHFMLRVFVDTCFVCYCKVWLCGTSMI